MTFLKSTIAGRLVQFSLPIVVGSEFIYMPEEFSLPIVTGSEFILLLFFFLAKPNCWRTLAIT